MDIPVTVYVVQHIEKGSTIATKVTANYFTKGDEDGMVTFKLLPEGRGVAQFASKRIISIRPETTMFETVNGKPDYQSFYTYPASLLSDLELINIKSARGTCIISELSDLMKRIKHHIK